MKEDMLLIVTDLKHKVARLDELYREINAFKKTAPAWYNKIAPLLLLCIEGWFIYKYHSIHVILLLLVCLLAFVGWFLVFKVIVGDVILGKLNSAEVSKLKAEYDALLTDAERNKYIPSRYFSNENFAFIEELILYSRVDSIKEALRLLDEKLHNEEMANKVAKLAKEQEAANAQLRKANSNLKEIRNQSYYDSR